MKMPPTENQSSRLLSTEENLQVFKLLGNRCQTMCTTVVQVFTTQPPHHSQWFKKDTGILCFVKDNIRKNYFFRLFCLRSNALIWQHEMYNNMEYMEYAPYLHVFEGEEYIVAFNFVNQDEASEFKDIVGQKILIRKRREEKKVKHMSQSQTLRLPASNDIYKKSPNPEAKLAKRRRNITKADISTPMNFQHISHVGWSPESGYDINSEDEQLKKFFEKAGVSEKQLQDKDTREFIYDFINKHGGLARLEDPNTHLSDGGPPPAVPPRGPIRQTRAAPPPPPVLHRVDSPRVHSDALPRKPRPPSPPKTVPNNFTAAPPPPPPPPPPPMDIPVAPSIDINGHAPTPPPPMINNAALMESIRNGASLKPVEGKITPPEDEARGDLLSEIRKGIKLKPADEREIKPTMNTSLKESAPGNDLATALAKALAGMYNNG
ncbi:actin nucleation-promoting factor WASL-like [Cylas formicarius]|uniref:actin nucleation-promoting factor WASL-like n=1 Tax=Cylas formicarius TaxID=197179 RepID=UPI0029585F80|nr:actin nucleation-promoting factor WASL-like [Cylas formicarius]